MLTLEFWLLAVLVYTVIGLISAVWIAYDDERFRCWTPQILAEDTIFFIVTFFLWPIFDFVYIFWSN